MTETTQEERTQARQKWIVSQDVMHRLARDADRLAQAEKLLKRARPFDGPGADAEDVVLAAEIDSFTSDGGQ